MRRTRKNYAIFYITSTLIFSLLSSAVSINSDPSGILLIAAIWNIVCIALAMGRFRDLNANPWWSIATLIPFVSFILLFPKGTEGDNKYGKDPRQS